MTLLSSTTAAELLRTNEILANFITFTTRRETHSNLPPASKGSLGTYLKISVFNSFVHE